MSKSRVEHGIYFSSEDYIGLGRRLLIEAVDAIIALVLWLLLTILIALMLPPDDAVLMRVMFWTGVALLLLYFVGMKRSSRRTLGYVLARARLVDLQGQSPSWLSLLVRLSFIVFGPLNPLLDLFWISADPCRQALRDKFAGTYVIRNNAKPLGAGVIEYKNYYLLCFSFTFREVRATEAVNAP